jgi:hypothetical protein
MKSFDVAFGTNLIGEMKMTWSPEVPGIGGGTSDGPSLAVFNGRLFAAWKGVPNDTRMFYSSFDGHAWSPEAQGIGGNTSDTPSLAVFNNRLFAAWKGVPNDTRMFCSSFDGQRWLPEQPGVGGGTSNGPSLAVFNNRLFAGWKGVPNDNRMFYSSSDGVDGGGLPAPVSFNADIVTPSGTPLGGWVHLDVYSTGDYHVKFHMHSSSIAGSFDFNLRAYLSAPNFPTMAFLHNGHVSGVDSADYEESGFSPLLKLYWPALSTGARFTASKDYKWGGPVGTAIEIVNDLSDAGAAALGATLGTVIGATREAISFLGTTLGPGGTLGVIGGVVAFALTGSLITAVTAGAAIGGVTNALIKYRPLSADEKSFARQVFGPDSGWLDNVLITNLHSVANRGFTAPGVDGKTYCSIGPAFDNPLGPGGGAYPQKGQLLIHELTHAWQIAHNNFLPGMMCSALVNQSNYTFGDDVYKFGQPGPDWNSFNVEQQASIVDQWFGGQTSATHQQMDTHNPYYRYVWSSILGSPSPVPA